MQRSQPEKGVFMTQCENILEYMTTHPGGITPADAIEQFHCFRLAARIADLKCKGYKIESTLVKETRNGIKIQYSRYRLI